MKLNRALWQLAGKMAELKGAAPKVIDAEIVEHQRHRTPEEQTKANEKNCSNYCAVATPASAKD